MSMINGKDVILLVQPIDATVGSDALVIGEITENSYSIENDLIDEKSKFGRILEYGDNSESFEMSAYGVRGDVGQKAVLDAIKKKKKLKVWEVDLIPNENSTEGSPKYNSVFAECLVESVEKDNGDSFQEVSATLQVNGKSYEGELDELPEELINATAGAFEKPGETGTPTP